MHSTPLCSWSIFLNKRALRPRRILKGFLSGLAALVLFLEAEGQAWSQKIYWGNVNGFAHNGGSIQRANLDGSYPENLITGLNAPTGPALDLAGGKMYWTNMNDGTIERANLDGSCPKIVVMGQNAPAHLALDLAGGKVYWPNNGFGPGDIRWANLDGSEEEILIPGLSGPSQVALDLAGGRIYWVEHVGRKIQRANLDERRPELLVENLSNTYQLFLDLAAEKMYWFNHTADCDFWRANLDGTGKECRFQVTSASVTDFTIDVAAGKIYWCVTSVGEIWRANLDGSEQDRLITGLPGPNGIHLDLRSFSVAAPASVPSGTSFDVTVTALDPFGNIDVNYQGTVTFSTSDTDAGVVLPADYTFTAADAGVHTFPGGVTLVTVGDQTVTATNTVSGITSSATVTVGPGP